MNAITPRNCDVSVKKAIQQLRNTIKYDKNRTFAGLTLTGKLDVGSQASPVDVTTTRQYGFEIHYSGNDYDVTGIRSRAQLVTTDTSATAQGALLQAANNDGINAGILQGALIEAIGKSTANAATISTMRGALVGTEWGAYDTITNLKTLHIRGHSLNAAGAGSFGTGYGIYIENEAVGGNGQAYNAGIYFKGTNLSAGNKAFTYGIDFTGGTYGTADIKLSSSGNIDMNTGVLGSSSGNLTIKPSSTYKVIIQPTTNSTTSFQILDADGGIPIFNIDSTTKRVIMGGTTGDEKLNIYQPADDVGLRIYGYDDVSSDYLRFYLNSAGAGLIKTSGHLYFTSLSHITFKAEGVFQLDGGDGAFDYYKSSVRKGTMFFRVLTNPHWALAPEDGAGNQIIITHRANRYQDYGHGIQTNPTLYVQSDTNPNSDDTEWLSFAHNQINPIIGWGKGAFEFQHTSPYIQLHNTTYEDTDGGRESRLNFKGEQSGGEETTLARIEAGHDGSVDDEKGYIDGYTNSGSDGDSPTKQIRIQSTGDWVINKTSGIGIKVDLASPTFGWRDLKGKITNSKGSTKPSEITYREGITQFQFSPGDDAGLEYHIPHDYVPGTDIHLHIHWSHNSGAVTGGSIILTYEITYCKGHNQAAFPATVTGTITGTASSTQYKHIISEGQISISTGSGTQIDTDDLEPDGLILCRIEMTTNNMTGATPDPFIHEVDVHYQSTNLGTKQKAPNFYT